MTDTEWLGHDSVMGRDLFVLQLNEPEDLPDKLSLGSPKFVCLLAWDASAVDAARIGQLARKLLDSGAVYFCVWGADCERVHDIIDEETIGSDPPPVADSVVMTTWHSNEPLAEAIWVALFCSTADEPHELGCASTLALVIGEPSWTTEIRTAFRDPRAFSSRIVGDG